MPNAAQNNWLAWRGNQPTRLPGGLEPYSVPMPGQRFGPPSFNPTSGFRPPGPPAFQPTGAGQINSGIPDQPGSGGGSGVGSADSGHDFGGDRGPGPGARGSPGFARDAVDALFGLGAGAIAPGFGIAAALARTALDPSYNPLDPFGLFGGSASSGIGLGSGAAAGGGTSGTAGGEHGAEKGAATGVDASGLAGGVSTGGPSSPGLESGATSGAGSGLGSGSGNTGEGLGVGSGGTGPGGEGDSAGNYAGGGVVRGRGGIDSRTIRATPGEGVLNPGAMRMLGPHTLFMLNAMGSRR